MRCLLCLVLLLCLSLSASGQAVVGKKDGAAPAGLCELKYTEEMLGKSPERKFKVEQLEKPTELSLKEIDPKLIDQKFLASLYLDLPFIDRNRGYDQNRVLPNDDPAAPLQFYAGYHVLLANWGAVSFLNGTQQAHELARETAAASLARMVEQIPQERRPPKEDIDFLTSKEANAFVSASGASGQSSSGDRSYRRLSLPGETAEIAQRRVTSLLTIFDLGMSRPLQLRWLGLIRESCSEREQLQAEIDARADELATLEAEAEKIGDFTAEMLGDLRLRQVQEEVDLAGIRARLAESNKQLKARPLSEERQQELVTVRSGIEIELAGTEARQAKLGEVIGKVKSKTNLLAKAKTVDAGLKSLRSKLRNLEARIAELQREIDWFAPPPIHEGKMTVQPIQFKS
jgi:hypothetical protein